MNQKKPTARRAPTGLGATGRKLWRDVTSEIVLERHEFALVEQAARCLDRATECDALVAAEGITTETPQGMKSHPALVESRQQRLVAARLLAQVKMPEDVAPQVSRTGVRGSRGVYKMNGGR